MNGNRWCNLCQSSSCDHAHEFGILRDSRDLAEKQRDQAIHESKALYRELLVARVRCDIAMEGLEELLVTNEDFNFDTLADMSRHAKTVLDKIEAIDAAISPHTKSR